MYQIEVNILVIIKNKSKIKNNNIRPMTPILQSYLFTNSSNEPDLIGELKREIQSSDSIVCWNIYIEENRAYNINNKNCIFINDKWKNYLAFSNKKIDIIEDIKLNLLREF